MSLISVYCPFITFGSTVRGGKRLLFPGNQGRVPKLNQRTDAQVVFKSCLLPEEAMTLKKKLTVLLGTF